MKIFSGNFNNITTPTNPYNFNKSKNTTAVAQNNRTKDNTNLYNHFYYPTFKSTYLNSSITINDLLNLLNSSSTIDDLLNLLSFSGYKISVLEEKIISNAIPLLGKNQFEKSDYENLTDKEKEIIRKLIQKPFQDSIFEFETNSVAVDFKTVYDFTKDFKASLDKTYSNNYQIIGLGRSPDPFITVLKELGADATTIPFSKKNVNPYAMGKVPDLEPTEWKNYFNRFGFNIDKANKSNKKLIFTDYTFSGETKEVFNNICVDAGLDAEKYNFIPLQNLIAKTDSENIKHIKKKLFNCDWKKYAVLPSSRDFFNDFISANMNNLDAKQTMTSKLFCFALYDEIAKENNKSH